MKKYLKVTKKRFLIYGAVSVVIYILLLIFSPSKPGFVPATDGLFISGMVMFLVSGYKFNRAEGAFNLPAYGLKKLVGQRTREGWGETPVNYAEFVKDREIKDGNGTLESLIVGLVFVGASIVAYFIFK